MHVWVSWEARRGPWPLGAGVTDSCELIDTVAGNSEMYLLNGELSDLQILSIKNSIRKFKNK